MFQDKLTEKKGSSYDYCRTGCCTKDAMVFNALE